MIHAVVIGTSRDDAERWTASMPWLDRGDIEWVSPRSPDRARGTTADVVLATDEALRLPSVTLQRLLEVTLPCTAARRRPA